MNQETHYGVSPTLFKPYARVFAVTLPDSASVGLGEIFPAS